MKKVNFKKRVSQLMTGVFALALMGGVMLSSQEVAANSLTDEIIGDPVVECVGKRGKCSITITYPDGTTVTGSSKGNLVQY